jgi:hypothetical protein
MMDEDKRDAVERALRLLHELNQHGQSLKLKRAIEALEEALDGEV